MMNRKILLLFISILTLVGLLFFNSCKKEEDPLAGVDGQRYEVTITGNWNNITHPTEYPSGAHFSPPIGFSHMVGESFFNEGQLASPGMKEMAERGVTTPLDNEINTLIANNKGLALYIGDGIPDGTSSVTFDIKVTKEFPLVTLVSMLAPSPDWFIGIHNISLVQQGNFVDDITINAVVYDAGTDSGISYTSPNNPTQPAIPITPIASPPLGNGFGVSPAVAFFRFVKK